MNQVCCCLWFFCYFSLRAFCSLYSIVYRCVEQSFDVALRICFTFFCCCCCRCRRRHFSSYFFSINSMVKYTIPNNTITMLYTIYMNTPQLLMFTKKKRLNRHFQREAYTSTSVTPSNIPTYVFISSFVAIVGCLVLIYLLIVVVCMSA